LSGDFDFLGVYETATAKFSIIDEHLSCSFHLNVLIMVQNRLSLSFLLSNGKAFAL